MAYFKRITQEELYNVADKLKETERNLDNVFESLRQQGKDISLFRAANEDYANTLDMVDKKLAKQKNNLLGQIENLQNQVTNHLKRIVSHDTDLEWTRQKVELQDQQRKQVLQTVEKHLGPIKDIQYVTDATRREQAQAIAKIEL